MQWDKGTIRQHHHRRRRRRRRAVLLPNHIVVATILYNMYQSTVPPHREVCHQPKQRGRVLARNRYVSRFLLRVSLGL